MKLAQTFTWTLLLAVAAANANADRNTKTYKEFMKKNADDELFHCTADHVAGFEAEGMRLAPEQWSMASFSPDDLTFYIYRVVRREKERWTIFAEYGTGRIELFTDLEPSEDGTESLSGATVFNLGRVIPGRDIRVFTAAMFPTALWAEVRWMAHGLCKSVSVDS